MSRRRSPRVRWSVFAPRDPRLPARAVAFEVAGDLLEERRVDDVRVRLIGFLLRVQLELHGAAFGRERRRVVDVEAFDDGGGLGDLALDAERMDRRDLGIAAERAHPAEP